MGKSSKDKRDVYYRYKSEICFLSNFLNYIFFVLAKKTSDYNLIYYCNIINNFLFLFNPYDLNQFF